VRIRLHLARVDASCRLEQASHRQWQPRAIVTSGESEEGLKDTNSKCKGVAAGYHSRVRLPPLTSERRQRITSSELIRIVLVQADEQTTSDPTLTARKSSELVGKIGAFSFRVSMKHYRSRSRKCRESPTNATFPRIGLLDASLEKSIRESTLAS
jgi:hypothetical protein